MVSLCKNSHCNAKARLDTYIHNNVGYLHTSGNKNIIFDMGHMGILWPFHAQQ